MDHNKALLHQTAQHNRNQNVAFATLHPRSAGLDLSATALIIFAIQHSNHDATKPARECIDIGNVRIQPSHSLRHYSEWHDLRVPFQQC